MDSVLHLLGIARKAGRVEVGEEPVGAAARAHQAKLILTACDGADNSLRLPPSPGAVTTTVAPSTGIWAWEA